MYCQTWRLKITNVLLIVRTVRHKFCFCHGENTTYIIAIFKNQPVLILLLRRGTKKICRAMVCQSYSTRDDSKKHGKCGGKSNTKPGHMITNWQFAVFRVNFDAYRFIYPRQSIPEEVKKCPSCFQIGGSACFYAYSSHVRETYCRAARNPERVKTLDTLNLRRFEKSGVLKKAPVWERSRIEIPAPKGGSSHLRGAIEWKSLLLFWIPSTQGCKNERAVLLPHHSYGILNNANV